MMCEGGGILRLMKQERGEGESGKVEARSGARKSRNHVIARSPAPSALGPLVEPSSLSLLMFGYHASHHMRKLL